jgi:chemotaxis protein CheD
MQGLITVGVSQQNLSSHPAVLRTILGSCVGICIYDRARKIGGMAHILLPRCTDREKPEKYADTAIPLLLEKLRREGCKPEFMTAKIAGGAAMFKFTSSVTIGQIGERNLESVRKVLQMRGIPIVAEDVGGSAGRVIDFFLDDGRIQVKAAGESRVYYKI